MNDLLKNLKNQNPVNSLYAQEYEHYFLCFCSLVCLLGNKKLNLANIFLTMLRDKEMRDAFKMLSDIDTDYTALKKFLEYDPALYKSKYIRNYLDAGNVIDGISNKK